MGGSISPVEWVTFYFNPHVEEFASRTTRSLSNAFTSAQHD
jgi:hypothetical protein